MIDYNFRNISNKQLVLTTKNRNGNVRIRFILANDGKTIIIERKLNRKYDGGEYNSLPEDDDNFEKFCFLYMEDYTDSDTGIIKVAEKNFDFTCDSYSFYCMGVAYRNSWAELISSKISYDDYKELRSKFGDTNFEDENAEYVFDDFLICVGKRTRKIK